MELGFIVSLYHYIFKYLQLKLKLKKVLSKIWFNKRCFSNIIPKYAYVYIKNS